MGSCCLQVLLVASLLVLGISGGFGTFWAYFNFPSGEDVSLKPPANKTTGDGYYRSATPEYREYLLAKQRSSNYYWDSRSYVIIPGSINALIAAVLLLACLFSRKIFSSTAILYSAVSLWAINLTATILFQYAAASMLEKDDGFKPFFFWIFSFHVGQLIMLTFQALVAGIELRWQKTAWPTINFSHLFTPSTIVLTGTMVLSVFSLIGFCESMQRGVVAESIADIWPYLMERMPDYCVFPSVVILIFGAVLTSQNLLCHLFGNSHVKLMGLSNLLAGILYCFVAVIASPAIVYIITGYRSYTLVMFGFALGGGLLYIIHGILCLAQPKRMTIPPKIVKKLVDKALSLSYSELDFKSFSELGFKGFTTVSSHIGRVIPVMKSKFTGNLHITLAILSFLSLILGSIGTGDYPVASFACIVIIAGDTAVLCRLLPSIFNYIYTKEEEISSFKMMLHLGLEAPLTLAGAIGGFCGYGTLPFAGVLKILIFLIMIRCLSLIGVKSLVASLTKHKPGKNEERDELVSGSDEEHSTESENENTTQPIV